MRLFTCPKLSKHIQHPVALKACLKKWQEKQQKNYPNKDIGFSIRIKAELCVLSHFPLVLTKCSAIFFMTELKNQEKLQMHQDASGAGQTPA